ncbi:hypothetical protein [Arsenicicoccus dermatophilus]|uniref:hypothetical protein n=1 Tax=Arsenicicoccus dermatophilus TaxID=1076331 RepID=UPI0039170AAE
MPRGASGEIGSTNAVSAKERPWGPGALSTEFELMTGTWPTAPGQVALAEGLDRDLGGPSILSVATGASRLQVTGVVRSRLYPGSSAILTAPGTIAKVIHDTGRQAIARPVETDAFVLGSGPPDERAMAEIAAVAVAAPFREAAAAGLAADVETRNQLVGKETRAIADRNVSMALGPVLGVSGVLGLLLGIGSARAARRGLRTVADVGFSRRPLVLSASATLGAACAGSALMGTALSWLLVLPARALLAGRVPHTLPPTPGPRAADLLPTVLAATCATAAAAGALRLTWRADSQRTRRRRARRLWPALARRTGAALCLGVALVCSTEPSAVFSQGFLGLAAAVLAALLAPDLVALAARWLRRDDLRQHLVKVHLAAGMARAGLATAILTLAVGLPLGLGILLQSSARTNEVNYAPPAPPGQLLVVNGEGRTSDPPDPRALAAVRRALPGQRAVPVSDAVLPNGRPAMVPHLTGSPTPVAVVSSAADLARLGGQALPPAVAAAFERGDPVRLNRPDHTETSYALRLPLMDPLQDLAQRPAAEIRQIPAMAFTAAYANRLFGLAVTPAGAARLGLAVAPPRMFVFSADERSQRTAFDALRAAGLSRDHLQVYEPRADRGLDPRVLLSVVFGMGLALVVSIAILQENVKTWAASWRAYLTLGLTSHQIRRVMLLENLLLTGCAIALGLLSAAAPAAWFAAQPGFVLAAPWPFLAGILLVPAVHVVAIYRYSTRVGTTSPTS